jgi:hypothetical protein
MFALPSRWSWSKPIGAGLSPHALLLPVNLHANHIFPLTHINKINKVEVISEIQSGGEREPEC